MLSNEILDTLLTPPAVSRLFSCALAFNRWEVYVELQPGVDPQALADTLLSLDNLLLLDATTQVVIHPSTASKVVEAPLLFLVCPPTLLIQYALDQVGLLTSITGHQLLSLPGRALLTLEHPMAAKVLAGCHIPFIGMGTIILTSGSPEKDILANSEVGLSGIISLQQRRDLLSTLGRSVLSFENVSALAMDDTPDVGNDQGGGLPPHTS